MIASLKGGVGKTTVTAALAHALSSLGHRTLAVDMDFGVRSLDIALGWQNSASPSCWDVMMGKASLGIATDTDDEKNENLFFLSAPMNVDCTYDTDFTDKMFLNFLRSAKREFDYVLLDMAAGPGRLLDMASASGEVDETLIVCTQNTASVRAAEKLGSALYRGEGEEISLVINSFEFKRAKSESEVGVMSISELSSLTLKGVIPFDKRVERNLSNGRPLTSDRRSKAGRALMNIAKRLIGAETPLFEGVYPKTRRMKLY